jgi:hypothetical protein
VPGSAGQCLLPIGLIPYAADEQAEALMALGLRSYWDTCFAGRAAPLGRAPAEVVPAIFCDFAPGEAARHIPRVWDVIAPDAALAARQQGCVIALRRLLGARAGPHRRLADQGGDQPAGDRPPAVCRAAGSAPARGAGRPVSGSRPQGRAAR